MLLSIWNKIGRASIAICASVNNNEAIDWKGPAILKKNYASYIAGDEHLSAGFEFHDHTQLHWLIKLY